MNDTPTPIRDIPTLFTITYSDGYATKLVDAAEYDRVFSDLTAAREELDEMTLRWELTNDSLFDKRALADRLAEALKRIANNNVQDTQQTDYAYELGRMEGIAKVALQSLNQPTEP